MTSNQNIGSSEGGATQRARGNNAVEETAPETNNLLLPDTLSVHELANLMEEDPIDVIKELIRQGVMANINQVIDFDIASKVTQAYGFEAQRLGEDIDNGWREFSLDEKGAPNLTARPPVVTILGHVDHGKTTLLDAIRESNVTDREVGGITQHIGAYQVEYSGQKITFLDTPGHEAFTAMRARGARATDIAVLVVAADDGIMPQTIEAMDHARAAQVPIIVAINKMDVPGADVDRVKRQLVENGLVIEEWGGEVITVPVSAKEKQGIDELLDNILVVSEVEELRANPERSAVGVIVEAQVDKSKGPVATVLVQTGTLRTGGVVVVGRTWGRVRALFSDSGSRVEYAGPSTPVELLGLSQIPMAGDILGSVDSEKIAKDIVGERDRLSQSQQDFAAPTLEDAASRIGSGEISELNLIIKTDVQGTVDAVRGSLSKLSTEKARVSIVHAASGSINETDVMLATASRAIVIGFSTKVEPGARKLAETEKVDIRQYDIIYRLVEDVQRALSGLIAPEIREVVEGHVEVRAVFSAGRRGNIAGSYVTDGRITRNSIIHIIRGGEIIHRGLVASLKHFKDDVREMATGFECGVVVEGFTDYVVGDVLEVLREQQVT